MKAKRFLSLLMAIAMVLSLCPVLTTAAPANDFCADSQWEDALLNGWVSYYAPGSASQNSEPYYANIGGGHLQGMCVDEDASYMYVSYTNGIGKIDMDTGEVAGVLTGFDSGLHIGCMAYYDGYIYASFEAQATHKFYIIQVDESKFWGLMDSRDEWLSAVRVILLYEPTVDARDLMGDTDLNSDNLAGRSEVTGHRFSNAGIDGITFGTYPGEFGKEDADTYMFVVYGTYWFGTSSSTAAVTAQNNRYDDEHTIIQAYNTADFLNEENQSQYLLELAYTDETTPDKEGVANARSIYYANDSILHAEKTLYVFTGNTQWGCQNFEYDKSTGDIWLATYGASNGSPAGGKNWFVIDGSVAPQTKEIQLGQKVNLNTDEDTENDVTLYGSVAGRTQEERITIATQAKERAERYTNKEENVTNNTTGTYYWWETDTDDYNWYADRPELSFTEEGYLVGDIPYLKCLCGSCTNGLEGKGDYLGYTKENGYDTDNMLLCGASKNMTYGLTSLGNGYWFTRSSGGTHMYLEYYDWETHAFTTINSTNIGSFIEKENLGAHTAEDLRETLTERLATAKEDYPTQESFRAGANWSDSCWNALQAAVAQAEAALTSSDVDVLQKAIEDLKLAKKNMRVGVDEFLSMTSSYIEEDLYTPESWEAYAAVIALMGSDYPSQTLIDDQMDELTAAYNGLIMKSTLVSTLTPLDGTPAGDDANGYTAAYDVADKGCHVLSLTVADGTTVKVTVDGKSVSGTKIPISGASEVVIWSSTADGVTGNFITYYNPAATLKSISVNGAVIDGFSVGTMEYTYRIPAGGSIPFVSAEPDLGCSATVTQAQTLPGVANISVTRPDGTVVRYQVYIAEDPAINGYEYKELYASDIADSDILWATTYPNRRGQDGENERFMRDQGWVFPGNADAMPNGIAADGTYITYTKGFTLHGITSYGMEQTGQPEVVNGVRKSDATIKQEYVDADNLIGYSSVSFDIEGKGYTTFTATISPDAARKNHGNMSCTVRFYVDGELVKEQKMHGTSAYWGLDVEIDLTGAKTFTVQVDPENVDGIGRSSDWANGDIITFGNAKFSNHVDNMPETVYVSDLPDSVILGRDLNFYGKDTGYGGAAMEIPNTDGSKLTFIKGITLEGTAHKGSDAAYKQPFIDSDTLSEYSRVEYNLEGLGVTTFKGTMGLTYSRRSHAQTSMTVRFYVDDVLVEEYILHPENANTKNDLSGRATEIEIDLTGAKTFSIQVDPENRTEELGYTGQGVDSVNDWAWGDIITIGNARLVKQVASFDEKETCTDHSYSVGHVVASTCTSFGYTRWTCPNCGDYTVGDITDKLDHDHSKLIESGEYLAEAATCTAAAKYYLVCADCGHVGTKTQSAGEPIAHTYDQELAYPQYLKSEATHTSPAVYYKSCTCGAYDSSENAATFTFGSCVEHVFYKEIATEDTLKTPATCTEQAVYWKSCTCGAISTDEADVFSWGQLLEHVHDQEIVDEKYLAEEANCTFHAKYYLSCVCGHAGDETFVDENSPLGDHVPVVDKAVMPTYTSTGLTEGSHCDVCKAVLVAQEEVPMLTIPEPSVPETTAPETTVPETTAPETTVPETTVPETTVPETTAPETTVPETTDPGDSVPGTGDGFRITLGAGLLLLSGMAVLTLLTLRRKRYAK